MFDVSSPFKFQSVLGTNTFTEEHGDYAYIWKNNYDPISKLCEMELTFFVQNGTQYDRFHEVHLQRAHTPDELIPALEQAGFTDIRIYNAFTRNPAKDDSERLQFAATKR